MGEIPPPHSWKNSSLCTIFIIISQQRSAGLKDSFPQEQSLNQPVFILFKLHIVACKLSSPLRYNQKYMCLWLIGIYWSVIRVSAQGSLTFRQTYGYNNAQTYILNQPLYLYCCQIKPILSEWYYKLSHCTLYAAVIPKVFSVRHTYQHYSTLPPLCSRCGHLNLFKLAVKLEPLGTCINPCRR